jgi:hypothetical protein
MPVTTASTSEIPAITNAGMADGVRGVMVFM